MTVLILTLSSAICFCLQAFSRNLQFAIVAAMGYATAFLVLFMETRRVKWPFALAAFLGNGLLLAQTVAIHQTAGHVVNDYLIMSAVLVLTILITVSEWLSQQRKTARA